MYEDSNIVDASEMTGREMERFLGIGERRLNMDNYLRIVLLATVLFMLTGIVMNMFGSGK